MRAVEFPMPILPLPPGQYVPSKVNAKRSPLHLDAIRQGLRSEPACAMQRRNLWRNRMYRVTTAATAAVMAAGVALLIGYQQTGQIGFPRFSPIYAQGFPSPHLPLIAGGSKGVYRVSAGDTLWGIAGRRYKDTLMWPYLLTVNPSKIQDPDQLFIGKQIRVPKVGRTLESLSKIDRKRLAEGYVRAYLAYRQKGTSDSLYFLWAARQWDPHVHNRFRDQLSPAELRRSDGIRNGADWMQRKRAFYNRNAARS